MNLIDKDALIESLGIETDCDECEHERPKYYCGLNSADACKKIIEAPVISVTTESAEKAIEVFKNAAWLGAVYSFEETEEAVKTAIRALQVTSAQPNVQDSVKDADCISRTDAIDAISKIKRTDNWQAAVSMALMDLPSAQPEIIRCRDCKYYTPVMAHCEIRGKGLYLIRGMEDFCSRAERRTDD